jgi:microcystin-dependent protein
VATVTGVSAAKLNQVKNDTIISARVENGILYFKKGDGVTEFNVGKVVLPAIDAWPVGSIFMNTQATNPKDLLGGGTWARWGQGKMPVSLDSSNSRFDAAEETGGLEKVQLTVAELANHDHGGTTGYQSHDHSHGGYTSSNGDHSHAYSHPDGTVLVTQSGGTTILRNNFSNVSTGGGGTHNHSIQTYGVDTNHYHSVGAQGGNTPHENMPPYIVVYMWKRTA